MLLPFHFPGVEQNKESRPLEFSCVITEFFHVLSCSKAGYASSSPHVALCWQISFDTY